MSIEYMVILLIIVGSVLSILIFIRKENIRKAFMAVSVAQSVTWPLGLLMVLIGKVEYPVRFFPRAVESSFLGGFILNPTIFAIYYVNYPKDAKLIWKWSYTLLITAIPASIEAFENNYTNLVKYKAWNGFFSWGLGLISYFILRKYLDWFLKNVLKQGVSRNEA